MARTGRRYPSKPIVLGLFQALAASAAAGTVTTPPATVHVVQAPSVNSHEQARARDSHIVTNGPAQAAAASLALEALVTPPQTQHVVAAAVSTGSHQQDRARATHVVTIRSSALANHAILQAGSPRTTTMVTARTPARQDRRWLVTAPRPSALTNHAILSAGSPRTVSTILTRTPSRRPRPSDVVAPRPSGLIFTPAAGVTTPPRTTWVIEAASAPRRRHLGAVLAPRSLGLVFSPAAAVTPPQTVHIIQAQTSLRRRHQSEVIAPRAQALLNHAILQAGRPRTVTIVDTWAWPRRRRSKTGIWLGVWPRGVFGPTTVAAPSRTRATQAAGLTRRTRLIGRSGDTLAVGGGGATEAVGAQGETVAQKHSQAATRVSYLGYSNQVLGGVDPLVVETQIGHKFTGLRQNQAYTTTGIATAITEYDAGRTLQYRSIQVDTLPGGWAAVTSGNADTQFTTFAQNVMANPTRWNPSNPFLVCFSHEASNDLGVLGTAQQYIDAWRHVRDLFDSLGATVQSKTGHYLGGPIKMAYVGWDRMYVGANGIGPPTAGQGVDDFDPDKGSTPAPTGTSYYEYLGSDVYNVVDSPGVLRYGTSAATLIQPIIDAAVARNKDWIIGEFGVGDAATSTDHTNKATWLDGARALLISRGRYKPGVCRALLLTIKASAENFTVDSSAEALAAFQRLGASTYFK